MSVRASVESLSAAFQREERALAAGVTAGMRDGTDMLKEGLRSQVRAAGLGTKVANTWRAKTYPERRTSLHPTAYAWSNAPEIAIFFDSGQAIVPLNGHRYLAIPTKRVPRGKRGKRLSVGEVMAKLGQRLIVIPGRSGRLLGLYDASLGRAGKRRKGARRELILLFTFVPEVRGQKRTDVRSVVDAVGAEIPLLIERSLA